MMLNAVRNSHERFQSSASETPFPDSAVVGRFLAKHQEWVKNSSTGDSSAESASFEERDRKIMEKKILEGRIDT
jgi:hypothetical protein